MKKIIKTFVVLLALTADFGTAQVLGPFTSLQGIPDNDPNGLVSLGTVSGSGVASIQDLNVWIEVSGGSSGDLYVTLEHDGVYSVLLNRPGKDANRYYGYADPGFSSSFRLDDQAPNGDVHTYRFTLLGSDATPLLGPLDGAWEPDGRTDDPADILGTDSRSADLSGFNGLPADGEWRLHAVDLSPGGASTLVSWTLELNSLTTPAPELNILLVNTNVVVSWPFPSLGYVLEQNPSIGMTNWMETGASPTSNGLTLQVIEPSPEGSRVYRLRRP